MVEPNLNASKTDMVLPKHALDITDNELPHLPMHLKLMADPMPKKSSTESCEPKDARE